MLVQNLFGESSNLGMLKASDRDHADQGLRFLEEPMHKFMSCPITQVQNL